MADDSTTIELTGPNSDRSPATRWRARGQHWRSSNVNALTIGTHERRSTLRRRSRMEASGPRRYVTAMGCPPGGSGGPRCGTGCGERRYARGRPRGGCGVPPPPAESYSGQAHPGSAAHAARAFELSAGDDPAVGLDQIAQSRILAPPVVVDILRRYPSAPPGGRRVGELIRILDASLRRQAMINRETT